METNNCRLNGEDYIFKCYNLADYAEYERSIFEIFKSLYENGEIKYNGLEVRMKHYPPDYGETTGFYHMICENYNHTGDESDRMPNLQRCERIKWPKEMIEWCATNCNSIWVWENERHKKKNVLIYCPEENYLVVLAKRNEYYLLTTAYVVEYENAKRDLIKEYNAYKTNNASHRT